MSRTAGLSINLNFADPTLGTALFTAVRTRLGFHIRELGGKQVALAHANLPGLEALFAQGRGGFQAGWIVAALAALAGAITWWSLLELELLGWDSYPMIVAGRVTGFGELIGTFGEELMDGRYPLGRFWRPMAHLAFVLDDRSRTDRTDLGHLERAL